ncbi:MAG: hypothetical protein ABI875_04015 [Gemmatimonadales bacterium]
MKAILLNLLAIGLLAAPLSARADEVAGTCDASLWSHVYQPKRLVVVEPCIEVTGVIIESDANSDGDQHFLLRLDPGQEKLLKKRNMKKKEGALVVEIVCANPATKKKEKAACVGYANRVTVPSVGSHVRVSGSYVVDTHNNWAEIHPASQIIAIK